MRKRIYLAGRYARREELRGHAERLRAAGFEVVSAWLEETLYSPTVQLPEISPEECRQMAMKDLLAIHCCELVLSFTEPPTEPHVRGGRHVEFGYALALGKAVAIVGPAENIFHYLPGVVVFPDLDAFLKRYSK